MIESPTNRIAALTFWVVVWFIGLAGLALASGPAGSCTTDQVTAASYYSPSQTTSVYQSADGIHTVLVRPLRPVVTH